MLKINSRHCFTVSSVIGFCSSNQCRIYTFSSMWHFYFRVARGPPKQRCWPEALSTVFGLSSSCNEILPSSHQCFPMKSYSTDVLPLQFIAPKKKVQNFFVENFSGWHSDCKQPFLVEFRFQSGSVATQLALYLDSCQIKTSLGLNFTGEHLQIQVYNCYWQRRPRSIFPGCHQQFDWPVVFIYGNFIARSKDPEE